MFHNKKIDSIIYFINTFHLFPFSLKMTMVRKSIRKIKKVSFYLAEPSTIDSRKKGLQKPKQKTKSKNTCMQMYYTTPYLEPIEQDVETECLLYFRNKYNVVEQAFLLNHK